MDIIIFTCLSGIFFQRSMGAYQIAHFLREHGYTVQVIDFTDYFDDDELLEATKRFVTDETLAIGISTTFYTVNDVKKKFIHNDRNKFDFLEFPSNILTTIINTKLYYMLHQIKNQCIISTLIKYGKILTEV